MSGTPRCRVCRRAGAGPRLRSTGSTAEIPARSSELLLFRSGHPVGEALARGTAGRVPAGQPLDVRHEIGARGLQAPQLAAQAGVLAGGHGQPAAEVHLEALHQLTIRARYELAFQPDVGDLGTG